MVKIMSKKLIDNYNIEPMVLIIEENLPSLKLFQDKIGFDRIDDICWMQFKLK